MNTPRRRSARPFAKRLGDGLKIGADTLMNMLVRARPSEDVPAAADVRRILLVRVNFRLGNTVLLTSLLPVLRARFPDAAIDVLAADKTACLLDGLGFGRIHLLSRDHIRAPWRFARLVRALRRQRYDVTIDGGMSSFSGALYGCMSGARWRIGSEARHPRLLNVRLPLAPATSVYDAPAQVARAMGVGVLLAPWPSYSVAATEACEADKWLGGTDVGSGRASGSIIGVFVGGHRAKRLPHAWWLTLLRLLEEKRVAVLLFVGPEERDLFEGIACCEGSTIRVVPPGSLRRFAALLARAALLVTPDSGPMHLAAALRVPVLALLQEESSRFYVPTGTENIVLVRPQPADVLAILAKHPGIQGEMPGAEKTERPTATELATALA